MSRTLVPRYLLLSCLMISVSYAMDNELMNCNCDDEGYWNIQSILECQRVSDFFIAVAYFSIPIELLYFVSCSNVPFKWVLLQFIAFIVLCGLAHLLNGWTYYGPHSFQLMLSLTIAKFLTALVSCATAITLLTLIPLLLKVKMREVLLRQNVMELDQEVGLMKRQKEASWHVRMLTREIRKSLDRHKMLYTTLVVLSKTLDLHNCAVWMPNEKKTEMNLTHELKATSNNDLLHIPINDVDVLEIKNSKGVKILRPDSPLGAATGGKSEDAGAVAAIRMPILHVSNFKGGTHEFVDTHYALLVLVLPGVNSRMWTYEEMEIVEVVADQVAVALSHAAVLEESQLMREQLSEKNRALQQAKKNAMMASQARNSFQKVMSHGTRRPMHSILGLLSIFQNENMDFEQRIIVDTLVKVSNVLSTLINDVMKISAKEDGRFPLEMKPFRLHSMIKEASCLAKCLCAYKGLGFETDMLSSLPDLVIGDEKRTFQVILHMVGHLLDLYDGGETVIFQVFLESSGQEKNGRMLGMQKPNAPDEKNSDKIKEGLSFRMCKKLVHMMEGNIWMSQNSWGLAQSIGLVLRFHTRPSHGRMLIASGISSEKLSPVPQLKGLWVMLADDDGINRIVTKKLLEKIGCEVTAVSSGFECLSCLSSSENSFRLVILDLHMPEMDGFEVAMRIRKFCSRNWPLIIALTTSSGNHVLAKCLQMGMNGVIRKPVLLQEMADELRRVLLRAG
uniref:Ethylene receptor n=1 Tax=Rhizophora mucronata TaxID=61149 RepID=A0A2P2K5K0_RHIMU